MQSIDKAEFIPGQTLCFSNGVYSNYELTGVYKCLKYFSLSEVKTKFEKAFAVPKDSGPITKFEKTVEAFITFLLNHQYIKQIDAIEIHCGDYDFNLDWVRKF